MKCFLRHVAAIIAASVLVACGGGGGSAGTPPFGSGGGAGGGSGGGATGSPAITMSLQDSAGNTINPPALVGTQNATVVVSLRDGSGNPVANALVRVSSDELEMTPTSGQTLTDSSGIARVQVRPEDPFAGGAAIVSATADVNGQSVQTNLAIGLGAATASLGQVVTSSNSVAAYQTVQVSVPVTLSGSSSPAIQYPVNFSANCGTFDPATALSGSDGIARSTYRNQVGTTACSGTVTLTAQAGSSSSSAQISTVAPAAANIQFVSASPSRIYLAGSPGASQSIVTFRLLDSSGNPVTGETIELALTLRPDGTYLGSTSGTTVLSQSTDSNGQVSVAVNAGTAPGPVQIQATLQSNTSIRNVSNSLAVASGLPVQRAFSLSVSSFNIEGWRRDGVTTDITMRVADRLGNPVPDGTTINFIAEGGQIAASCNTTGAATNGTSACTVRFVSQNPRPLDGRVTILAWAQGEESFVDSGNPTNNVYDTGEAFTDLGQPFLDKNEDGVFNVEDVTVGTRAGNLPCPSPATTLSTADSCDGAWGQALVRASAVIVLSGSDPVLSNVTPVTSIGGNRCSMSFTLRDENNNPMPSGTRLAVSGVRGGGINPADATFEGIGGSGDTVPNTAAVGGTQHTVLFSNCGNPSAVSFTLSITTPVESRTTRYFLP